MAYLRFYGQYKKTYNKIDFLLKLNEIYYKFWYLVLSFKVLLRIYVLTSQLSIFVGNCESYELNKKKSFLGHL